MIDQIITQLDNPQKLEALYRSNKAAFKNSMLSLTTDLKENPIIQTWQARLTFKPHLVSTAKKFEAVFILLAAIFAGFIAKLPDFMGWQEDLFFQRNISFVVIPSLIAYFVWKKERQFKAIWAILGILIISVLYINALPALESDTLNLASIHLPLFLWALLGFSFMGGKFGNSVERISYLKFNGELAIITGLILIAGGILTALTLGLFSLIEVNIQDFYLRYVVVFGLSAAPVIGAYLIENNPGLVSKIAPIIARVFTPLVFITLFIYLWAMLTSGKDPYNDREFLLLFNVMLLAVMAIIFFSIVEQIQSPRSIAERMILSGLAFLALIINGVALSAIFFRLSTYGLTPNRLAVLGGNLLILIHLILVAYWLVKAVRKPEKYLNVERSITGYLPVYAVWAALITFLFPLIFGFR
jgi:hypothetical protein